MSASIQTKFETVGERDFCNCACFTGRDQSSVVLKSFYEVVQTKSEKFSKENKHEKIQYGEAERQYMDVFYPKNVKPETELVVFYHGGYWQESDTSDYYFMGRPITNAGMICILVGRTLIPEAISVQAMIEQDKRAMACILQNYPSTSKITLCGHSSGGHECTMMLSNDWSSHDPQIETYLRDKLKRVVSMCGVYEIPHLFETSVGEPIRMSWADAITCSPIANVKQLGRNITNYGCEFILVTVENEAPTIHKWTRLYERELNSVGAKYKSKFIKNLDHFKVVEELDEDSITMNMILGKSEE